MPFALFTPELPEPRTSILPVCALLGLQPVRAAAAPALAFAWQDTTVRDPLPATGGLVNGGCPDIRKSTVDAAHRRALGYGIGVEARTHVGALVEKSEANAAHDARVRLGPVERPAPGRVVQRLVRNELADGRVEQLRVPVVRGEALFAYVKRRPRSERFASACADVALVQAGEVLSARELTGVLALCAELGLDFGELDVLRDRDDGRIYVVDVATTPFGPPLALGPALRGAAVGLLAEAVQRRLLEARSPAGAVISFTA